MPYRVQLRSDLDLVIVHCWDGVTQNEIETALAEMPRMDGFRPGLGMFVDFRNCTTAIGWWQIRFIAAFAREHEPAWGISKWAIVVSSDVIYGLVRIYVALANRGDVESRVFRDAEAASAWLDEGADLYAALEKLGFFLAQNEGPASGSGKSAKK